MRILIGGIGNIFLGDDAFGCEVAWQLAEREWPEGVHVEDFGIRSYDLAYALTDNYDAAILVDAASRSEPPGTVFLFELDPSRCEAATVDPHRLDAAQAIQMASTLGPLPEHLYLVGCEPAALESEEGPLELSPPVQTAVPRAIQVVESLVQDLFTAYVDRPERRAPALREDKEHHRAELELCGPASSRRERREV